MSKYNEMRKSLVFFICMTLASCIQSQDIDFKSTELVSSKKEKIYINSINWGVTGDNQYSAISKDKDRLKQVDDTLNAAKGLEPFIYSFRNDSLTLFFNNEIFYKIKDSFNSIKVTYIKLDNKSYSVLYRRAIINKDYHTIPIRPDISYPSNMPK